jgi:hypothetical protein
MAEYKLDFPVNVGSAAPMRGLADAVREVADRTKASQSELSIFKSLLEADAKAGISLSKSLDDIKRSTDTLTPGVRTLAGEFQKFNLAQTQVQIEAKKTAQAIEQNYTQASRNATREIQNLSRTLSGITGIGLPGGSAPITGLLGGAAALGAGGGIAALLAAASVGIVKLANETGEYAREQANLAIRTGLTTRETQEFSQMARVTGVNVGSLTTMMRTLSKGLSDNSEEGKKAKQALQELGLDSSVAFQSTGRAIAEIFEKLGGLQSAVEKDRLAIELFGRGGLELLPMVDRFRELEPAIRATGVALDEQGIQKAKDYQQQLDLLTLRWDNFKTKLGVKAIGIVELAMKVQGPWNSHDWEEGLSKGSYLGLPGRQTETNALTGRKYSYTPSLPRDVFGNATTPDPFAMMQDQRGQLTNALDEAIMTPRQRIENEIARTRLERTKQEDIFKSTGDKAALQKVKDLDAALAKLQAQLDGLKKSTESFSEAIARFANRGEPSELARKLAENREATNEYERRFPGHNAAWEAQSSKNAFSIFNESIGKQAEKNAREQTEELESRLRIESLIGEQGTKRIDEDLKNPTSLISQVLAASLGPLHNAPIPLSPEQLGAQRMQRLQLGQAISGGALGRARASGQFSPQQLARMELQDQLASIYGSSNIEANQFRSEAANFKSQAQADPGKAMEHLAAAANAELKAKEAETKATIEAVGAVSKFQEAAEEASAKIREEFGGFISGLAAAAREGHAGSFSRNFLLGQSDKIVSNIAQSLYRPGMFQLPGQGPADNPTMLGKWLQGTIFGSDPKAHQDQALTSITDLNTKATIDNTTALAGMMEAMGYDPTSLGLSSAGSIPQLTPLSSSSSVGIPFFGGAGNSSSVNIPFFGLAGGTSSASLVGANWTGNGEQIGSLYRAIATSDGSNPLSFSSEGIGALDTSIGTSQGSNPLGNGDLIRAAPASQQPWSFSTSPLGTLFGQNSSAGLGQQFGAGLTVAGSAFGAVSGIQQITKGGAQNTLEGIGKTAMAIAPFTGPAAPFIMAGAAALELVGSLFGDPRAERQASINHELFNNQYIAPVAINRSMNISGNYSDLDFRGNVRGSDLSSIPLIQQAYPDPRHGVIVPGTVLSPFGGGGPSNVVHVGNFGSTTTANSPAPSQPSFVQHNYNISAIDQDSVAKFFQNHPQEMGDGMVNALNKGGSDMINRMRTL